MLVGIGAAPRPQKEESEVPMKLSVHITDCAFGVSAADVDVLLRRQTVGEWKEMVRGRTGPDGALAVWNGQPIEAGIYQMVVDLDAYYAILGTIPLHPRAIVEFRVLDPEADLFLPLIVSSHSCLSYRGAA
jgi:5-hydroxyisourate hydrolase